AEQAVQLVPSGASVAMAGLISLAVPEMVLRALGKRFEETAEPGGLTVWVPNRPGWKPETGVEHLAHPGMVKRVYAASYSRRDSPRFVKMAENGEIEAYSYPMGCLYRVIR